MAAGVPTRRCWIDAVGLIHDRWHPQDFAGDEPRSMQPNWTAGVVAARLLVRLGVHLENTKNGEVVTNAAGYRAFAHNPKLVRYPDLSYVRPERLIGQAPSGHLTVAPDLAVEIASPGDSSDSLETKLADYHRVGTLVWVIYP
jgi:Uma2 family endonuclease